jgi:hypothetical protein
VRLAISATSDPSESPLLRPARVVETLVPIVAAIHAAFVFSPEDEPALEILLASRRPVGWTVAERLAVLLAGHGSMALVAGLAAARLAGETPGLSIMRWVPPLLVLTALAVCVTISTRQSVFSVCIVLLLWFSLMLAGEGLLMHWPSLWPIQPYLQPDHDYYALNRAGLTLAGLGLIWLASSYLLRDDERVLLGSRPAAREGTA